MTKEKLPNKITKKLRAANGVGNVGYDSVVGLRLEQQLSDLNIELNYWRLYTYLPGRTSFVKMTP